MGTVPVNKQYALSVQITQCRGFGENFMQEVTSKNAGMPIEGSSLEPSAPVQLVFPISTATASKVSPTEVSSESAKDLPPPNWEMWRTRGACRIWQAVLISMAINPTSEVRTILRREQPRRYAEYISRKKAVVAQYGLHPSCPRRSMPIKASDLVRNTSCWLAFSPWEKNRVGTT